MFGSLVCNLKRTGALAPLETQAATKHHHRPITYKLTLICIIFKFTGRVSEKTPNTIGDYSVVQTKHRELDRLDVDVGRYAIDVEVVS